MLFSTCSNDNSFGPNVLGCRDDFDFTVRFEQLFFSLIPGCLFIAASLGRTAVLLRKPVVVNAPSLQLAKLAAAAAFAGLQLAMMVLVGLGSLEVTPLAVASSAVQLAAALCIAGLSLVEHSRSPRPSVLLGLYLLLTTVLDVAQARTYWLAAGTRSEATFAGAFTTCMAVKGVMLLLEAQRKTMWMEWNEKEHSPEETSGIYSLGVYFWLNNLFMNGYNNILRIRDLYPLDSTMSGQILRQRFAKHADYSAFKNSKYALVKTLASTLKVQLLLPVAPRLALLGFMFCQPFFINALLEHLSRTNGKEPATRAANNAAYGFIGASICIYTGIAVSQALYSYFNFRALAMLRGCLVTAIYAKATEVEAGAGEADNATVTLMSTDVERTDLGLQGLHDIWASVLEVGLASWLLYELLGPAFVAPIVVVLCCVVGISVLSNYTGAAQRTWMEAVQRRVGLTGTVIANMKSLKMSGLAGPVSDHVQKLRVDELRAGGASRMLSVLASLVAFTPLLASPVLTFGVARRSLDAAQVFTALSYLMLLSTPLLGMFQSVPRVIASLACLGRIQAFLASETRRDCRAVAATVPSVPPVQGDDISDKMAEGKPAVVVRNGSFGWTREKMALSDINMEVPRGSLTLVVGPVGSGKSTLTKALLGELPVSEGVVEINTLMPRVGFCDQIAFLSDASVRENIVGFSPFSAARYAEVISATMLEADLASLPQGDATRIGSNGISLSGGQRQRVSLARALYLAADLLVLDDVFSGLDADTEDAVFRRVFGAGGLLRRRGATAVLCTHSVRHLPAADSVVVLAQDGRVAEQGTFEGLVKQGGYVCGLDIKTSSGDGSQDSKRSSDSLPPLPITFEVGPEPLERTITAASMPSEEDKARQTGDKTVYKHYFQSMGIPVALFCVASGALVGFLYSFGTIWLKFWAEDTFGSGKGLAYYVGIYGMLQALCLASLFALAWLIFLVSVSKSGSRLHQLILTTLVHAPLKLFTVTDQGVILNLFSQDLNLVDVALPNAFCNVLFSVFLSLGSAIVLVTSSPYMAISYPFLAVLMWIVQRFYLRTSRQLRLLDLEAKSPLYTHFLDTTKGIVTLRAFGFTAEDRAKNTALLDTSQRPAYLLVMIQQWLVLVLKMVVTALAATLTALAVRLGSSSGFTGASLVTLMSFGDLLSDIVMQYTQLETSIGAIARLRAFAETIRPEDREGEDVEPPEEWPAKGEIELRGVSASYYDDDDNETSGEPPKLALSDIHLTVAAGEKVAICGRTGSGKSSLVSLVLKLLDQSPTTPDNVSIDGLALCRIDRQSLRSRLLAVPQDAVFLPDGTTFQKNLDPFERADARDCESVLAAVGLWSFVQERGGLDAGMSAGTLSQGQRQLFSLARVVLRRRLRARSVGYHNGGEGGVLLLDEVSSSVDRETERTMQEVIGREFARYTILAVSHRLDMIIDFDRVVVMDQGRVVEVGRPRELVEAEESRFGDLWRAGGN